MRHNNIHGSTLEPGSGCSKRVLCRGEHVIDVTQGQGRAGALVGEGEAGQDSGPGVGVERRAQWVQHVHRVTEAHHTNVTHLDASHADAHTTRDTHT